MTKAELIKALQEDTSPDDIEVVVYDSEYIHCGIEKIELDIENNDWDSMQSVLTIFHVLSK